VWFFKESPDMTSPSGAMERYFEAAEGDVGPFGFADPNDQAGFYDRTDQVDEVERRLADLKAQLDMIQTAKVGDASEYWIRELGEREKKTLDAIKKVERQLKVLKGETVEQQQGGLFGMHQKRAKVGDEISWTRMDPVTLQESLFAGKVVEIRYGMPVVEVGMDPPFMLRGEYAIEEEEVEEALPEGFLPELGLPTEKALGSEYEGDAFRASGVAIPEGTTVGDIIRYEIDELGNSADDFLDPEDFDGVPGSRSVWVTDTREAAQRYAEDSEGNATGVVERSEVKGTIVGRDGEGGFLVVQTEEPPPAPPTDSEAFREWFKDSVVVDENGEPMVMYHGGSFNAEEDQSFEPLSHFGTKGAALERIGGAPIDNLMKSVETFQDEGRWFFTIPGYDVDLEEAEGYDTEEEAKEAGKREAADIGQEADILEEEAILTEVYLSIQNPLRIPDVGEWGLRDVVANLPEGILTEDERAEITEAELDQGVPALPRWDLLVNSLLDNGFDGIVYRNTVEDKGKDSYVILEPTQVKSATKNLGTFSSERPSILESPGPRPNLESPAFREWFKESKVVDADGNPMVVYHGSVSDITAFQGPDQEGANVEADFGAGIYFSNSKEDVSINYAGYGPDTTSKLENRAEQMMNEDEDLLPAEAVAAARKEIGTNEGVMYPVYLSFQNPVIVGGANETFLDYELIEDEEGDYQDEKGTLVDFIVALRDIAEEYQDGSVEEFVDRLLENGDGVTASEIVEAAKASESFGYYTNDEGQLVRGEMLRRAFEEIGFDGIIDNTVNKKFGTERPFGKSMVGIDESTVHYIAFEPTQIKSAIGNRGTFSSERPSILESPDRVAESREAEPEAAEQSLKGILVVRLREIREQLREYGMTDEEIGELTAEQAERELTLRGGEARELSEASQKLLEEEGVLQKHTLDPLEGRVGSKKYFEAQSPADFEFDWSDYKDLTIKELEDTIDLMDEEGNYPGITPDRWNPGHSPVPAWNAEDMKKETQEQFFQFYRSSTGKEKKYEPVGWWAKAKHWIAPGTPTNHTQIIQSMEDFIHAVGNVIHIEASKEMGSVAEDRQIGKVRIYGGRLSGGRGVLGEFHVFDEIIKLRFYGDIMTAAHEAFHAIEKMVFGRKKSPWETMPKKIREQLYEMGHALYGDKVPNGGYMSEGWAEFGRYYLIFGPEVAKEKAPHVYAWFQTEFLKKNPGLAEKMEETRKLVDKYYEQPWGEKMESFISEPGFLERMNKMASWVQDRFFNWFFEEADSLDHLFRLAEALERVQGQEAREAGVEGTLLDSKGRVRPSRSGFRLHTALRNVSGSRVWSMVTDGMIDINGNRVGRSLAEAAKLVQGMEREFMHFLVARRILERKSRGFDSAPKDTIEAAREAVKNYGALPNFVVAAQRVYDWNLGLLNYAVQAGAIPPEVAARIVQTSELYVPMGRVFDDVDSRFHREVSNKMGVPSNPLYFYKGSYRRVNNPFVVMIAQAERMVRRSHHRMVINTLVRLVPSRRNRGIEGIGHWIHEVPVKELAKYTHIGKANLIITVPEQEKRISLPMDDFVKQIIKQMQKDGDLPPDKNPDDG
jgi:hypothetical protein